jgi:hypothetical protein
MSRPSFSPEMTVPEALMAGHPAQRVFVAHRTACVGCDLARFCTLRDVAWTYGLSLETLVAELEDAARTDPLHPKGERHENDV